MDKQDLVKELATRINAVVNIPLINEKNEQAVFELILGILLGLFLDELEELVMPE